MGKRLDPRQTNLILLGGCPVGGCALVLLAFALASFGVTTSAERQGEAPEFTIFTLVALLTVGGALGVMLSPLYLLGARLGWLPAPRSAEEDHGGGGGRHPWNRATPKAFSPPWGARPLDSVEEALMEMASELWGVAPADVDEDEHGVRVVFRSSRPRSSMTVTVEADDGADLLRLRIDDDLGGITDPVGPWQAPTADNRGLAEAFAFVEEVLSGRLVHVVGPSGRHRLVTIDDLDRMVALGWAGRARSWSGRIEPGEETTFGPRP